MQSTRIKVRNFLKNYPNCKNILYKHMNKYEAIINKKDEGYKAEKVFEKAKRLCKHDTANFKKPSLPGFKYKLELLNNDHPDYDALRSSFIVSGAKEHKRILRFKRDIANKKKVLTIYRVVENIKSPKKMSGKPQTLLLHGTKAEKVEGILKKGFKPSKFGYFGPGVYHSDSIHLAFLWGKSFGQERGLVKKFTYYFVNQVEECGEQTPCENIEYKTPHLDEPWIKTVTYQQYLRMKPNLQVYDFADKTPVKKSVVFQNCAKNKFDSRNRTILQGTFHRDYVNGLEFLAHHDLVVPAYLFEIVEKPVVGEIIGQLIPYWYENKNHKKVVDYTFETITKELKKQIFENKRKKIAIIKSKFDNSIQRTMEQLSFRFSSIFELNLDKSSKYKTELLQEENDDYKFVLNSIISKSAEKEHKKIKHVLKIHPANNDHRYELKGKHLLYHGVKSNKLCNFLANGYLKEYVVTNTWCKENWYASTKLDSEIDKGASYCLDDNKVRKISFVFVVGSKHKDHCSEDSKIIKDSRGSVIDVGSGKNLTRIISGLTPAYLIVFDLE